MKRVKKSHTRESIFNATRGCSKRCVIVNVSDYLFTPNYVGQSHTLSDAKKNAKILQKVANETYDELVQYVVVDTYLRRIYWVR